MIYLLFTLLQLQLLFADEDPSLTDSEKIALIESLTFTLEEEFLEKRKKVSRNPYFKQDQFRGRFRSQPEDLIIFPIDPNQSPSLYQAILRHPHMALLHLDSAIKSKKPEYAIYGKPKEIEKGIQNILSDFTFHFDLSSPPSSPLSQRKRSRNDARRELGMDTPNDDCHDQFCHRLLFNFSILIMQ